MNEIASEEKRQLCSVQRIQFVSTIENKDKIVLARVLGYQLIVNKHEIFADDLNAQPLVLYFESDAVLDAENPQFAFMSSRKWRVQTMKMAGLYSEGLALPLEFLRAYGIVPESVVEGQDVTQVTKTTKYLNAFEAVDRGRLRPSSRRKPYRPTQGKHHDPRMLSFGRLFPQTEEPNLKSHPFIVHALAQHDRLVTVTEKYDGMSASFYQGRIFSRNCEHVCVDGTYHKNADMYLKVAQKYDMKFYGEQYPHYCFQGEIVGPACNGNRLGLQEIAFFVFNVYDVENQHYITMAEIQRICEGPHPEDKPRLQTVPILVLQTKFSELPETYRSLNQLMALAESMKYPNGFPSEGIVVKTDDQRQPRHSCKIISRAYLDKIKS